MSPRLFFMIAAAVAAAANAAILLFEPTSAFVIVLRFVTGMCIAGLYPVGMKIASTWADRDSGFLIGVIVGGLTLGAAVPHLLNALGSLDWHFTLIGSSVLAAVAGLLINAVELGPAHGTAPPFQPSAVLKAWTIKPIRLANLGYVGHLWELYAMWAWIAVYLHASFVAALGTNDVTIEQRASLATFSVIGVGALTSVWVGRLADSYGRTLITAGLMLVSGTCALIVGPLFGSNPWLVAAICLMWGAAVVPDAPQTSACVIELSDKSCVGTMLTVQTCVGFMLTLIPVHVVPMLAEMVGWQFAFMPLAAGPMLGALSMWRLRRQPEATRLAGGNR
jgi:MFS family permease